MLNPDVRHLLTDALRPPHGWRIDAAVATTYTLDLNSLLLAPLSMAAYDQVGNGIDGAAPHELLEAIRRYAERTVVLCQAGGIHVPSTYRKLTVFAEESIIEVAPPAGRVFHPKIWVLRFTNVTGEFTHRLVCLSRNLTGDRSWDTVLSTDEDPSATHQMAARPLSGFLRELLDLSVREIPPKRAELVRDVARTLRDRSLAVPSPFTGGLLLPFGTSEGGAWPVPARADRSVVISPFLDATTVRKLPAGATIVSRPDTFNRLGAAALDGFDTQVLQPHADAPPEDLSGDNETDEAGDVRPWEVKTGLHAKVLAWDSDRTAHLLTGSANATSAAFGGNIEFGVLLTGPVSSCGAAAILKDDDKQTGFTRLLQPFQASTEPEPDLTFDIEREIEEFHIALAAAMPVVTISHADGQYDARLDVARPEDPGQTWVRPVTLKPQHDRPLEDSTGWRGLGHPDITPFVAVRTRVERDGVVVERSSALRAELVGAPEDRSNRVLRELLSKVEDILRYLALLLKDPGIDDVASALLDSTNDDPAGDGSWGSSWADDLILLEPLVRAAAREDDSIDRVKALMDDLRDADGKLPDLGADFESLWHVVLASKEAR
ncbi:phospholipase D family protein [Nocardioides sediminis]|uniref:phospholipase D family protein n=1 Tax=Nocardioides sediminis TaxID=433648 RepID=UPI000D30BCF6|nr:phospholipase D family protein [Nocardioides sediminis]